MNTTLEDQKYSQVQLIQNTLFLWYRYKNIIIKKNILSKYIPFQQICQFNTNGFNITTVDINKQ